MVTFNKKNYMEYDLTDYSAYLDYEREEGFRRLLNDIRMEEEHEKAVDSLLLEMEVMQMLEII
jgi:ATP phosphoribosyltransferase regulatory subunit HisZ